MQRTIPIVESRSVNRQQSPTLLNLLDLTVYFPVANCLCSLLPIGDIISLSRTCKRLSNLYHALLPLQWNVDRKLKRFVRDPLAFRSRMGKSDALISGSFAVQYFERVLWEESDMDVFVQRGKSAMELGRYLCTVEGYESVRVREADEYMIESIHEVETYERHTSPITPNPLKIQLIITAHVPIEVILSGFYTTTVVNCLSWNAAYAIFPLSTFIHRKGYMLKPMTSFYTKLLAKYSARGWDCRDLLWPEDLRKNHPIQKRRTVADRFTWKIPFDVGKVQWSQTPDHPLEYAEFCIHNARETQDFLRKLSGGYHIMTNLFESHVLKFQYLTANKENYDNPWTWYLGARVNHLTIIELYKIPEAERPEDWYQSTGIPSVLYRAFRDFEKPRSWKYFDEEVPTWFKDFETMESKGKERIGPMASDLED